jgi:hypothetical protein
MKKPVQRVSLLEDVLSDLMEVEDILLKLELKEKLQPLTAKQRTVPGVPRYLKATQDSLRHADSPCGPGAY